MSSSTTWRPVLLLTLGSLLIACGRSGTTDTTDHTDTLAVETSPSENQLLNVGGKVFSIPSPVQAALAIRKSGLAYKKDMTAPLEKGEAAVDKVSQSTRLGLFGADLAYAAVHKDGQRAMATMQAIEKLGGKLELTNSFDRSMLDRFKTNLGSEDSLLQMSGTAFRAADQYLKNNDRDDVSALVLAGGWIESLYLTVSDPEAVKDQALMDRVGEQKAGLNALVDVLENSDKEKAAGPLLAALKELQGLFSGVSSTYTFQEPVTDAAKKTTFINSTSSVNIPAEKLTAIVAKVTAIRNMMLA